MPRQMHGLYSQCWPICLFFVSVLFVLCAYAKAKLIFIFFFLLGFFPVIHHVFFLK